MNNNEIKAQRFNICIKLFYKIVPWLHEIILYTEFS